MPRVIKSVLAAICLAAPIGVAPAAEPGAGRRADQEALKAYGTLVGAWKGVGQPQRGSARGAWAETADWAWKLSADTAALNLAIGRGKYLKAAELRPGAQPGRFTLAATLADGSTRTFAGRAGGEGGPQLVATAEGPGTDGVRRITLTPLHETRFLLLLEGRTPDNRAFTRLGEVGYTRQGVPFAAGESYPTCIVTGGRGTIAVKYQGQTYHVCCSGCKDLFQEDPEAILAEAKARGTSPRDREAVPPKATKDPKTGKP